ncbi:hypothetical protein ADUPG1_012130 [Aduncisulcus paluster]|uniref:Uncharacterized protein n=1 Tax=Aduncisulcus paluster TaxID=2918883 RepID=A0ABQ5JZ48_9EUKA|nr:hypothetical protein ADUPG1_012130 [Aduncisulcus paluster]
MTTVGRAVIAIAGFMVTMSISDPTDITIPTTLWYLVITEVGIELITVLSAVIVDRQVTESEFRHVRGAFSGFSMLTSESEDGSVSGDRDEVGAVDDLLLRGAAGHNLAVGTLVQDSLENTEDDSSQEEQMGGSSHVIERSADKDRTLYAFSFSPKESGGVNIDSLLEQAGSRKGGYYGTGYNNI